MPARKIRQGEVGRGKIEHPAHIPATNINYLLFEGEAASLSNHCISQNTWLEYVLGKGFLGKFCSSFGLQNLQKALYTLFLLKNFLPKLFNCLLKNLFFASPDDP